MNGNKSPVLESLKNLMLELTHVEDVEKALIQGLRSGIDPVDVMDLLNETLEEVGKKYESGEFFLSDLIMFGCLATQITSRLKTYLVKAGRKTLGRVVFGTVKGDIHDIGKNIVIMMLDATGFEVVDLGVNVPAERFLEAIVNERPDALCMSSLLTSTMNEMKVVIDVLKENGLRNEIKVIVGGRPVTEKFSFEIGADGYAKDAVEAVRVVKGLVGKRVG